jgi:UDP-3-O-[3-hydroxymyristoyl] glucosamine N-acyltransferase
VVGNNVILAGQTGIAGHCTVGDGVILTAQSAVSHDIPPGKMISGSPGLDNRVWLRAVAIFQRLPELFKRLDRLEKKVESRDTNEQVESQEPETGATTTEGGGK